MAVPGFVIRIHNSLTTPLLTAGVPRQFFILNGTLGAAIVLGMQSWYGIPIFIVLHTVAVLMTKKDPQFFQVMVRHIKQKNYYGV
ncbi:VirB3 family type IV secretion system protein [Fastidiosibacter lacustris]|uniref:VirB3 family type IV secretion system protein n=1 Tax=Fastidiosibacter lacustris TaxID=2056695 RepID=UPI000E344A02|nr:VirB3 family type IV secretion system protein [Fastidiosibacter lacustris]